MKNNILKIIVFCLINLSNLTGFAQLGISDNFAKSSAQTTPGDNTVDGDLESTDQVAPINDFIIPMFILGSLLSIYLIRKKPQIKS